MKECKEGAYVIEYMRKENWKGCDMSYTELSVHKSLNIVHLKNVALLTE